jgi:hypothetical protein
VKLKSETLVPRQILVLALLLLVSGITLSN